VTATLMAATEDREVVTATPAATAGPAIARVGVAETGATAADDETSN
jgi:hypothetical protein